MKKIIEISNDPSFNKGVVTYVIACNLITTQTETDSDIKKALILVEKEHANEVLKLAKSFFPNATVKLIDIK